VLADALRPRYPEVPAGAGLYESLYFTAHHPAEPKALWVRHTVLKPALGPPRASLWCTWFDGGGVRAAKVTTREVSSTPDRSLVVGDHGWLGAGGSEGAVDHERLRVRWQLAFHDPEPPMFHLPRPWMYRARLPRTKSTSATPHCSVTGSVTVDGVVVGAEGWPCTIGHNWGAEHAERWIWLHADGRRSAGADADDGPVWLDVVIGRVRLGPVTTPWIGNGALSVAGERYRLGGLRPGSTRVVEGGRGATVTMRGRGITVESRAEIDLVGAVGWTYADPAGQTREVVNSSLARTTLQIERDGRPPLEVTAPVSAFELGAPRRPFDVPLQPFPD
jgi:hypothetical protein